MTYCFKSIDKTNGRLVIDSKGSADGYFFAGISTPSPKRLKLKVNKEKSSAVYDLKNNGSFEMFPLQFGSGTYQIVLYENLYGTSYNIIGTVYLNVQLKNKNASFLAPSQYINYHQIPELVSFTKKLCMGKNKNDSFRAINTFIKNNFLYDYVKAINVKKGTLPDIKGLLKKKQGICFDIASLAVAMLRVAGIPAKLVVGFADNQYHAWVEIINENKNNIIYDPTQEIYGMGKKKTYSPERFY